MATSADLQSTLDQLGLGFLYNLLLNIVQDPNIDASDTDAVSRYIDNDPASQDAIKTRFSGNQTRVANGLKPLKPSEYIAAEQDYINRLRANGMPVGFYDSKEDLAKLIGGDVSAIELDNRIQRGYQAAMNAPQSVKTQLENLYGITDADLAAYYLDPTKTVDLLGRKKSSTLFARQLEAANIAAQAQTQANINLGAMTAEELAAQGKGAMAEQAFQEIAQQQELYRATTGEQAAGEQGLTTEQQIAGTFGTNAEARKAIEERRRRRKAAFEAGGGLSETAQGITGLRTVGQ